MAKKNKLGLGNILACVGIVLGVVALIMLFVPQLSAVHGDGTLNGLKITFGYSESSEVLGTKVSVKVLNFSFGNFLTYILVVVGIVFAALTLLGKLGKIAPIVAAAAFVVAGVLFFLALPMTMPNVGELKGDAADAVVKLFKESYTLGAGAIIGGILSILAGGATLSGIFIKK